MDKLLTWKIHEYCEGKLIDDRNQFVMLELNYEKLKIFTEKLEDGQVSQRLKLHFLKIMQEAEKSKLVDALASPRKFKECSKMTILTWVA